MAKELIINASLPEVRIALMDDGRIQELLIERDSEKGIVGNIYKGRVTRVLPGMQAAFVDIGLEKAAFLYVDDIYVHPKVMGDDAEVTDAEAVENADTQEELQAEAPEGEAETSVEASADVEAAEIDSSQLDHAADHAEHELVDETDEDEAFAEEALEALEEEFFEEEEEDEVDEDESDEMVEEEFSESESAFEMSASETDAVETLSADEGSTEENATEENTSEENATEAPLQGLVKTGEGGEGGQGRGRRFRNRNRRRGRGRNRDKNGRNTFAAGESNIDPDVMPDSVNGALYDKGDVESDRAAMEGETTKPVALQARPQRQRSEFREQRNRDRRIKPKHSRPRAQANIADLLKEGQEVIVQVAKDPIATKGARLTCHVSLPGRHLVCMPTIDHVGVSRRIERDDERRRLRDFVEKNRPRKLGFIVRTASGGKDPESWIKQDIDYLSKLWGKIRNRADDVSAPSLVYEDLNSVLRSIRDWVNEDIDKIIVDSRYHYNELLEFAERFMPSLIGKIELYQGDLPVFDAYGLSSELYRSLERRVWLKSGGYIVIDQAEALVAIDVNTGRFVGKKNLEDTILKTNIEAAEEIAYQLRLRNCGGIIICDFIDMERDENRMRVYRALEEALRKDRARPTIQKISELGLVEMTRKRTRDTIIRTLCEPCAHCEGKGFGKSKITVAYEILRECERLGVDRDAKKILISAHESVIDILAIELRDVLDTLERRYNKTVYLQSIFDFHNEQYEVVTDRAPGKKQNQDIARQLRIERDRSERKEKQKQRQKEAAAQRALEAERVEDELEAAPEAPSEPAVPVKRPEGQFIARPKAEQASAEATEENSSEVTTEEIQVVETEGEGGTETESVSHASSHSGDDEDQLAYLRAQAAQDAALASYGSNGSPTAQTGGNVGGQRNSTNRNPRGQRNQNQRNQNQRGGRHARGSGNGTGGNDRGSGRFRQRNKDSFRQNQAAPQQEPVVVEAAPKAQDDSNS